MDAGNGSDFYLLWRLEPYMLLTVRSKDTVKVWWGLRKVLMVTIVEIFMTNFAGKSHLSVQPDFIWILSNVLHMISCELLLMKKICS